MGREDGTRGAGAGVQTPCSAGVEETAPGLLALMVTLAAIALFVVSATAAIHDTVLTISGAVSQGTATAYALLMNIAVILIGWLRYHRLTEELARRIEGERLARSLADRDPLTGCLNRRAFLPAVDRLVAEGLAENQRAVLMLVDLDSFKQVNDRHGHEVGDQVLTMFTARMTEGQRPGTLVGRMGGDEFACAVLLREPVAEQASAMAKDLLDKAAEPFRLQSDDFTVELTLSIGLVAVDTANGMEAPGARLLLNQADIAMYRAKQLGKNRFAWFRPHMRSEMEDRRRLEQQIRAGLVAGEFVPFYEQQIDIATGELVGFEMLARWHSADGIVPPDRFIPLAEELGLIAEISESLLSQALVDASEWDSGLTLSINVSPVQLRDPWFAQRILKLLVQHNFPPARLDLEITESCLHHNLEEVRTMIFSLRNQGVRISLDDFGTGYASLAQLRDLSFDHIKIDRSFVGGMAQGGRGENIVDAVVQLGRALGLPVTAEGIETDDILHRLKERGSLKGQGYLYGKPESGDAVRRRLHRLGRLAKSGSQATPLHRPKSGPSSPPDETRRTSTR